MFVTILTSIYLALAIFVLVRFANKKRKQFVIWVHSKGLKNTFINKIAPVEPEIGIEKANVSQAFTKQHG